MNNLSVPIKRVLLLLCVLLNAAHAFSQLAKTQTVMVSATALGTGGIRLRWPAEAFNGSYDVFKRTSLQLMDWGNPITTLAGTDSTYLDATVLPGTAAEYFVLKRTGSNNIALGFVYAGNKLKETQSYGGVILLVDSNYIAPLSVHIQQLKTDLQREGWMPTVLYAGRFEAPPQVKSRVVSTCQQSKTPVRSLMIIGHVPVAYSGNFSTNGDAPPPDGHVEGSGNHTGAWPADVYYGELNGSWTDALANCTTGASTRNYNIPGDGKFDQTKLPDDVDLEVGRIDLVNLPAFQRNDTLLMQRYFIRNHLWRTGMLQATDRALIDNNFTTYNLAASGYANFSALVNADSIFTNRDYMVSQKNGSYLWSYGCGAGSYTNCIGVGNTQDFNNDSFNNVFTMLAGSFFGDWDSEDNLLRAPLASSSLASFWGGIPKWYIHHMAMGMPIGYGAKLTQNNIDFYFDGGFNKSGNSVHIALMGDPTLKLRNIAGPGALTAVSQSKNVILNWVGTGGSKDGYNIYIIDSLNNYKKVNDVLITDTFYTDTKNYVSGTYNYAVRALRLETTASGSYYNVSGASTAMVDHVNGIGDMEAVSVKTTLYPNPTPGIFTLVTDDERANVGVLRLSSIDGRMVYTPLISQHDNLFSIDAGMVPVGIYILSGDINGRHFVKKVVIIR